ncbi:MAG TPA: polysaccharide deacetylase family protein [Tenuifilaceae bacterium]|nr:polysaccharide deacetylase family protein [Tenuifilaceae bacterium]HPE19245.1 polysaccharide deacetylase family protein [Tenuifilaceae bacterium]HPJ46673.1 polysaccharide deacetylase family protein [Tenuifilaceae bacterium]HPQ34842.1 polysaccharide deacetylase family protein [Tenuifilaceae bacterium]HRX69467.1 polysaccharide deacetylase family protein [Tenuifilaceae bacterium]
MQILVYTEVITPRVTYIFNHILSQILGFDVIFTQDKSYVSSFSGPVVNYSTQNNLGSFQVIPHQLLFEEGIESQQFDFFTWRNLPAFFPTDNTHEIPFDIFAASFFLISRYEEYLPHEADKYKRFRVENSVAYWNGFLEIPLVDLWIVEFGEILKQKFPSAQIILPPFKFLPTIDIDNAFAYKHKGFFRSLAGIVKSTLSLNILDLHLRLRVIFGFSKDPFDTYLLLFETLKHFPQTIWFILGGKYGRYDKNVSLKRTRVKKLIRKISSTFNVGVHPSFASYLSYDSVNSEILRLKSICRNEVASSRQHFLRVKFPETYRILVQAGIKSDYSMGYSSTVGFRASTCHPFNFFDLTENRELSLSIVPFQVMDRALLEGKNLSKELAVDKTIEIAMKVKEVGGTFVTVWHNESLSGVNEWKGWENVFSEIVDKIVTQQN